jgi:hypothetical protein
MNACPIAVVVIHVPNNDYDTLLAFVPRVREALGRLLPRELVVVA